MNNNMDTNRNRNKDRDYSIGDNDNQVESKSWNGVRMRTGERKTVDPRIRRGIRTTIIIENKKNNGDRNRN